MTDTAEAQRLTNSFFSFYEQASQVIDIKSEEDYANALDFIEHLMINNDDNAENPILHLIDIVATSIEKYEDNFEGMKEYIREVEALDPAVSTLRVIIAQNHLTYSDLSEEIGSKSLVSQIVHGTKNLTRNHIAKLSERFHISPELFF